jgi:hypothetical protein
MLRPAVTLPPGELMYMLIGRSLSDSRKRSEAVTVALGK